MGNFLVYILKSAVCLAMFYLFYRLLLSKETFHRFNRMALLGVMLLSCLLPLVKVTVEQVSPVNAQVMSMEDLLLMYQWNSEAVVVEEGSGSGGRGKSPAPLAGRAGVSLFCGVVFCHRPSPLVTGTHALSHSSQPV